MICTVCACDLPENGFKWVNNRGKKVRRKQCRKCYYNRRRLRELASPEIAENRRAAHRRTQTKLRRVPLGWCKAVTRAIRSKCKKQGIKFELTYHDVVAVFPDDCKCPVFKHDFDMDGHSEYNASIDRLVPSLGYIPGNIAIISHKANAIKNNATAAEIRLVADWLVSVTSIIA